MEKVLWFLCISISMSSSLAISLRNSTKLHGIQHGNPHHKTPPGNPTHPHPITVTVAPPVVQPQPESPVQRSTLCNVKIFRKLRLPWMDAFSACKALGNGSELMSLRSEEDYNLITTVLRDADSPLPVVFWTSGVDLVEEGTFAWMSDGSTVDMTRFWSPGQPDNLWDSEHCLSLRRKLFDKEYKLADENCHLAGAFVCAQRCP